MKEEGVFIGVGIHCGLDTSDMHLVTKQSVSSKVIVLYRLSRLDFSPVHENHEYA